eukprot:1136796-Pelagomonas_calceolata.AAC.1
MGAGSFPKGKLEGVMERIAFKVDTREGCVRRGVITLNSLVFGKGICAFITREYGLGYADDEALDTVCNVGVAPENGGCYCSSFSPYNGIGKSRSISLDIIGTVSVRMVDSCSNHTCSKVDMAAAICVCPLFPVLDFSDQ